MTYSKRILALLALVQLHSSVSCVAQNNEYYGFDGSSSSSTTYGDGHNAGDEYPSTVESPAKEAATGNGACQTENGTAGNHGNEHQNVCENGGKKEAEKEKPAYTVTGALIFATDYCYRGLSLTMRQPCVQGYIDFIHTNGIFLGIFGSNVDGTSNFFNNTSMEFVFYSGYKEQLLPCKDIHYTLGVAYYVYAGGKTYQERSVSYNTVEWYAQLDIKWFNIKFWQTLTNYFGFCSRVPAYNWKKNLFDKPNGSSKGSPYVEINASFDLWEKRIFGNFEVGKLNLKLHAGYQAVRHYSNLNYADWFIALSQDLPWFNVGLSYIGTNAKHAYYDTPDHSFHPNIRKTASPCFVGSLTKTF